MLTCTAPKLNAGCIGMHEIWKRLPGSEQLKVDLSEVENRLNLLILDNLKEEELQTSGLVA